MDAFVETIGAIWNSSRFRVLSPENSRMPHHRRESCGSWYRVHRRIQVLTRHKEEE
jgi:hypothetical protein